MCGDDTKCMVATFMLTQLMGALFLLRPQTAQGSTALMLACKRGHEEVVRVLLTAGAELHQKDSRGRTARDTASKRSHETILAMLHPSKQMRLMQVGNCDMRARTVFESRQRRFASWVSSVFGSHRLPAALIAPKCKTREIIQGVCIGKGWLVPLNDAETHVS